MRTQFSKLALAVSFSLALAFTFSCSSNDDGGGSAQLSSSSSVVPSSSSDITYTLDCATVPSTGTAGTAITAPTVTCNGTVVNSGLNWTGAPDWDDPAIGTYSGVSVSAISGNCSDKTATCDGTLIVQPNVVYGNPVTYEGETYQTVVIGTQTWFQRNLNYAVEGSECYDDEESNCTTYGRLYSWATAMALPTSCNSITCASQVEAKHRGICPSGWHLPSDIEWDALTTEVGGMETAGTKLKSTSGWGNDWLNSGNTDNYGFSALPGGFGYNGGYLFQYVGNSGYWWTTTEFTNANAFVWQTLYGGVLNQIGLKPNLYSVRCVKD